MLGFQIILGLFFLYLTILGGFVQDLFSCELQRFVKTSIVFKHILVLLTIFIFTFVLGWYTDKALLSAKEAQETQEGFSLDKTLYKYIKYTFMIYGIFLITTKCDIRFLLPALIIVSLLIFLHINKLYNKNNKNLDDNSKIIQGMEITVISLLVIGFILYTMRQYKDHAKTWNILTYIFGNANCRS